MSHSLLINCKSDEMTHFTFTQKPKAAAFSVPFQKAWGIK